MLRPKPGEADVTIVWLVYRLQPVRTLALPTGESMTRAAHRSRSFHCWCSPSHLGAAISALEASVKERPVVRRARSLTTSAATPRRCWRTGTRSFATTRVGDERPHVVRGRMPAQFSPTGSCRHGPISLPTAR